MVKHTLLAVLAVGGFARFAPAAPATAPASSPADTEAAYTQAVEKRTADILDVLALDDPAKSKRVHDTIQAQYRALREWQEANESKLKDKQTAAADKERAMASRKALREEYLAKLSADLTPEQVEKVKDKMTYNKVNVTYDAYLKLNPDLGDEQKAVILDHLRQAREEAIDGGTSEEKSDIFNRYKGKINNYLSAQKKAKAAQGSTTSKPSN
jgi:signal transduction protein with GAF and PtsI domain